MNLNKIIKAHCPVCGSGRNAKVRAEIEDKWEDDIVPVSSTTYYRVLECAGCDHIYFQRESFFSEDVEHSFHPLTGEEVIEVRPSIHYWPSASKRNHPDWSIELMAVDNLLYHLLMDVYTALNNDLVVFAAIGVRAIFERATEILNIDPAITFVEKLKALEASKDIGQREIDNLTVLIDAGSAAAHRGWEPPLNELETMMNIVEGFLYHVFILKHGVTKLEMAIPQRPARKTKTKPI